MWTWQRCAPNSCGAARDRGCQTTNRRRRPTRPNGLRWKKSGEASCTTIFRRRSHRRHRTKHEREPVNVSDVWQIAIGAVQGLASSTVFVLVLFIGFCVVIGFTKLKKTSGGSAMVVKSLDERISHRPMAYLSPTAPRGPADQLKSPELVEAAARK